MTLMLRVDEFLSGMKHDAVNESASIRKNKNKRIVYMFKKIYI